MIFAVASFAIGALAACGDITSCSICTSLDACGWCETRSRCEPGTSSAGADGYCNTGDGDWFWMLDACTDAPVYGCSVCLPGTTNDCTAFADVSDYEFVAVLCPAAGCTVRTGIVSPDQDDVRMRLFTAGEYAKYINGQAAVSIAAGTMATDTSCSSKGSFSVSGLGADTALYLVGECANTFSSCNMVLFLSMAPLSATTPKPPAPVTPKPPAPVTPKPPTPYPTTFATAAAAAAGTPTPTANSITVAQATSWPGMYASKNTNGRGAGCCLYVSGSAEPVSCSFNDDKTTWKPCGYGDGKCCPETSNSAVAATSAYIIAQVIGSILGCCCLLACIAWLCRANTATKAETNVAISPHFYAAPQRSRRISRTSHSSRKLAVSSGHIHAYTPGAYWTPTTPVPHNEHFQIQATPTSWPST